VNANAASDAPSIGSSDDRGARIFVIVPASGAGARFGGGIAKQYADLAGKPLLARTLDRLASVACERTFVAVVADDVEYERSMPARHGVDVLRCGGATRATTVRNALAAIATRCAADDWILVHDAARPCVPRDALTRLVRELQDDTVGGLLAIPVADTLKRSTDANDAPRVLRTEDRGGLWQAQTPQMFRFGVLCAALAKDGADRCTDEAQAVEALARPRLVLGSATNIKITYPADLALAAAIIALQEEGHQCPAP
jgi:2-C-methyl-D-erythritol 4-phosphate cytidylyltransferase